MPLDPQFARVTAELMQAYISVYERLIGHLEAERVECQDVLDEATEILLQELIVDETDGD